LKFRLVEIALPEGASVLKALEDLIE